MKEIQLTQGLVTQVDDEDYEWLNQRKWSAKKENNTHYAVRNHSIDGKRSTVRMHRLITNAPKGMDVDHIDGNGTNNQRSNLRICTRSQNQMNKGSSRGSLSKYCGVSWDKERKNWRSRISCNYKSIHLGHYKDETDAALAYNEAALKYHGEFARLNNIES